MIENCEHKTAANTLLADDSEREEALRDIELNYGDIEDFLACLATAEQKACAAGEAAKLAYENRESPKTINRAINLYIEVDNDLDSMKALKTAVNGDTMSDTPVWKWETGFDEENNKVVHYQMWTWRRYEFNVTETHQNCWEASVSTDGRYTTGDLGGYTHKSEEAAKAACYQWAQENGR